MDCGVRATGVNIRESRTEGMPLNGRKVGIGRARLKLHYLDQAGWFGGRRRLPGLMGLMQTGVWVDAQEQETNK